MCGNSSPENREVLSVSDRQGWHVRRRSERSENVPDGNADMNADRNSEESIVPGTSTNNDAADASAESSEGRDTAKRNVEQTALHRTPGRSKCRSRGMFTTHRHSVAKRLRATLRAIKGELRKRVHVPPGETGRWLRRVVQGWLNYHAVPSNSQRLGRSFDEVTRLWLQVIRRRSQGGRSRWTWDWMQRLARIHLPRPRILHPYPDQRFRARLAVRAV